MSYTEDTCQPTQLEFRNFTCQSYKLVQQALGQQAIFFSVTAPLCIEEISRDRRYRVTQAVRELDDETTVTALAGQGQTLLRGHDCECAVCRCVMRELVLALLVHLKTNLLLPPASLPQSQAYVPAKNLLVAGSSLDLGRGSWPRQRPFNSTMGTRSLRQFL